MWLGDLASNQDYRSQSRFPRSTIFSIRAVVVKRFQANNSNFCRSRARASLRDQPLALPAWDQQEETEQSDSRTDRGGAIDTRVQSELVSSIVPRGTSLRWIVVLSLRQFGVRRSDCRRHFPCPAELGSITPHAMHNHGEPSCQCDDGFFLRAVVVKRFQANNSNFCRSRARASLRDQLLALPAWDQQEETEQSDSRTDRGRAVDATVQSELVSSIVPRGTSLRWIVVLSLRQFGVRRSDCRRHFPCPAELGSITPHAMHNHGEPSCQCDDGFFLRAVVVKRFQANNSNFCRSRARASLRDQLLALPAWDQQEETEQSDSRTDRGRAIETRVQSELVSSIVPRGTSLRWIVVLSLRQFANPFERFAVTTGVHNRSAITIVL